MAGVKFKLNSREFSLPLAVRITGTVTRVPAMALVLTTLTGAAGNVIVTTALVLVMVLTLLETVTL